MKVSQLLEYANNYKNTHGEDAELAVMLFSKADVEDAVKILPKKDRPELTDENLTHIYTLIEYELDDAIDNQLLQILFSVGKSKKPAE